MYLTEIENTSIKVLTKQDACMLPYNFSARVLLYYTSVYGHA